MRLALILSDHTERMRELQRNLAADFSVILGRSAPEGMDLLQTLPVDLVLVDLESDGLELDELPDRIREHRPHCLVVAVTSADGGGYRPGRSYDATLRADSTPFEITTALARVLERQRLLEELEQQRAEIRRLQARAERLQAARVPAPPVDKILKAFSRALSSGFDQERLLELFADTVIEMMRVSKVSVLLQAREPGEYRVRCFRGLRPDVAQGVRLRKDAGLAAWLAREGRIMTRELAEAMGVPPDVRKEMDVLQAAVSIPMMCSGMLVGVLNLNSRVTGSQFLDDELETLFTLAGHVAAAVRDTGLVRQMQYQKTCIEQILAQMRCGVITINDREQVIICNRSAGEIIGKDPDDLIRRDLRRLPSPLGDMLYETMRTGRAYQDEPVSILSERIPLLVSTHQLEGADGHVLGSVAFFEDVRTRPKVDLEAGAAVPSNGVRQRLARLAAEIRDPLARVQQLADALPGDETDESGADGLVIALRRESQEPGAWGERLAAMAVEPEGGDQVGDDPSRKVA